MRACITEEVHDQNTPFNGKLLDNDDGATLVLLGNLGQVDRNLGRSDADTEAVKDTSSDERAVAIARYLDSSSSKPPQTSEGNGVTPADSVGDGTSRQSTDNRSGRKSRTDGALDDAVRIVEVFNILRSPDDL